MVTSADGILSATFDPARAAVLLSVDGGMWPGPVGSVTVTRDGQPVRGLEDRRVVGGTLIGFYDHEAPLDTVVSYVVTGKAPTGSATYRASVRVSTQGVSSFVARRNLVTNPRGKATNGTVTVRENLIPKPRLIGCGWLTRGSTGTQSDVASGGPLGIGYRQYALDTPTTSSPVQVTPTSGGSGGAPVVGGTTYTLSAYMYASQTSGLSLRLDVNWYDAAGTQIGGTDTSGSVPTNGGWQRLTKTVVAPAGAVYTHVVVVFSGTSEAGTVLRATGVMLEAATTAGDYFDGSYSPDPDLTAQWSGAANASTSILTGKKITGWTWNTEQEAYQHTEPDGSTAARVYFKGSGVIGVRIPNLSLDLNEPYTMLAKVRPNRAMRVGLRINDRETSFDLPGGVYTTVRATATPTENSWTGVAFRAADHQPGDIADITDVAIVEGEYTGPFFDGSTPSTAGADAGYGPVGSVLYSWDGTPNASTSLALTVTSATPVPWGLWLKAPGRPELTVRADLTNVGDRSTATQGGAYQVHGGPAVPQSSGVNAETLTITVSTRDPGQAAALRRLLDTATARTLLLQTGQPEEIPSGWYFVSSATESNPAQMTSNLQPLRRFTLDLTRTVAPAGGGVAFSGTTYETVRQQHPTYADVAAAGTYADVARGA